MTARLPAELGRLAAGVALFSLALRATTTHPRLPYWDVDPVAVGFARETTLLPVFALALDAAVWLAAALVALAAWMEGRGVAWRSGVLILLGAAGALAHGVVLTPLGADGVHGELRSLTIGSAWAAALVGAWTLREAAHAPRDRAVLLAAVLGLAAMLVPVGVHEVFVEHAQTLARYRADPAGELAIHGITPGTAMARSFERRLVQPEPIAWFGLANVFGAVMAIALAAAAAAALHARGSRRVHAWVAAALAAAFALWLGGSKGAIAAGLAGVALAFLAASPLIRRAPRWGGAALAAIAILGPIAAVAVRGAIGERIGELSLLFRAHYLTAAARIFAEHPLLGVGPGGFKTAYALHKVPANPEQIEAAHSFLADWLATLGVMGLGFVLVAAWWGLLAARAVVEPPEPEDPAPTETGARLAPVALLAVLLGALAAWSIELPALTPSATIARLLGLGLWVALILAVDRWPAAPRALPMVGGVAALVALAHAQIELTPVTPSSAAWWAAVVALGAGVPALGRRGVSLPTAVVATLAAAVIAVAAIGPTAAWTGRLRAAAESAGAPQSTAPETARTLERADADLFAAANAGPPSLELDAALARFTLVRAAVAERAGRAEAAHELRLLAVSRGSRVAERWPGRAIAWSRFAGVAWAVHESADDRWARLAAAAWEESARLDRSALAPRVSLARWYAAVGRLSEARAWAAEALRADDDLRLDPLVRVAPEERADLEALAADRSPNPPNGPPPLD